MKTKFILVFLLAATFAGYFFLFPIGDNIAGDTHSNKERRIETTNTPKGINKTSDEKLQTLQKNFPKDIIKLTQPEETKWWHSTNVYQIWIRSFYDSNDDGHGDLAGITEKLDYIASLGTDTIWLTPIFKSPSYHGYDVEDYYAIDERYGSMNDFENLVEQAKAKGIRILLDLALNHVSEDHTWFQNAIEKAPKFQDYFIWKNEIPTNYGRAWESELDPTAVWHSKPNREGYYYAVFGWTQPDLNFKNRVVIEEMKSVAKFWLEKGVDGFRLDAIRYLVEEDNGQADTKSNLAFWREFSKHVKTINPNALLVGEALTETKVVGNYFDNGEGIDQAFEFDFNYRVSSVLKNAEKDLNLPPELMVSLEDVQHSMKNALWSRFEERENSSAPSYFFSTLINNHDYNRFHTKYPGDLERSKLAAALLLLSPGAVYLYYGEEIGMTQHKTTDDVYQRSLMQWDSSLTAGFNTSGTRWLDNGDYFFWLEDFSPWWQSYWDNNSEKESENVASQDSDGDSLLNYYRALINLRKSDQVISSPHYIRKFDDTGYAWVTKYYRDNEERLIVQNLNADDIVSVNLPSELDGQYVDLITNTPVTIENEMMLDPGVTLVLSKSIQQ